MNRLVGLSFHQPSSGVPMKSPEDIQYPVAVVISGGDSKSGTCAECHGHHGTFRIESEADLENLDLPPYHPNCVCEIEMRSESENPLDDYGTTREMADLLLQMNRIFEKFKRRFTKFGGKKVITAWYVSRLSGNANPELACRARVDLLLREIGNQIPDKGWFEFRHARGYFPNVGLNASHSWVELKIQYKDKHEVPLGVKVKYDPYYGTTTFMDPNE